MYLFIRSGFGKTVIWHLDVPSVQINFAHSIVKMKNEQESREDIRGAAEAFGATTVDYSKDYITLRLTDSSRRIDDFINLLKEYSILEICRTGSVSLEKGSETIRQNLNL